ncbi:hypothetical protein TKK_0001789 [Trichogramma kaykai]
MKSLLSRKTIKFGIPFLVFMVGGSFGLQNFAEIRYRYRSVETVDPKDEARKLGLKIKSPEKTTIEATYEELKKTDIDHWENKRIPRPAGWN